MSRIILIRWKKVTRAHQSFAQTGELSAFRDRAAAILAEMALLEKQLHRQSARSNSPPIQKGGPAQLSSLPRTSWQAVGGVCACGKSPESRL